MTFDNVPWVLDGALTKSSLARLGLYASTGGAEGVVGIGDLKVLESAVPDGNVRIRDGAGLILNRGAGGDQQTYAANNDGYEVVPITPAGAGGRHDMVILRVRDPEFAPWSDPPFGEEDTYEYVEAFVVTGVDADAETCADAGVTYSAIPLARIDIPASTATITQAYITDLRKVARPRTQEEITAVAATASDSLNPTPGTYEAFPNGVYMDMDVPYWATTCVVTGFVEGLRLTKATDAKLRVAFTDGGAAEVTNIDDSSPGASYPIRRSYNVGGRIAIPESYRGTNRRIRIEGTITASGDSGGLTTDTKSSGQIRVLFQEKAE